MKPFTKLKKRAQWQGTYDGWNKHVDKWNKRAGNKYMRTWLAKDARENP